MRRRHRRPLLITVGRSRSVDEPARWETRDREQRARPRGENTPVRGSGSLLQNRIPARSCDLYDAYAVTRVERFQTEVTDCRNTEDACDLSRDVDAVVVDSTLDGRRIVGALDIHGWVRQVIREVSYCSDHRDSLAHSETNGPLLGFPDGSLCWIIVAIEIERIGEVTVVRHVEAVRAGPHERANHRLRKEETVGVACFDTGDPHVRRHPDDTDPVRSSRDCAGRVW